MSIRQANHALRSDGARELPKLSTNKYATMASVVQCSDGNHWRSLMQVDTHTTHFLTRLKCQSLVVDRSDHYGDDVRPTLMHCCSFATTLRLALSAGLAQVKGEVTGFPGRSG